MAARINKERGQSCVSALRGRADLERVIGLRRAGKPANVYPPAAELVERRWRGIIPDRWPTFFFFSLPCTSDRVSLTGLHVRIRSSTTDEVMAFALMSPAPHLAQTKFFFFFFFTFLASLYAGQSWGRARFRCVNGTRRRSHNEQSFPWLQFFVASLLHNTMGYCRTHKLQGVPEGTDFLRAHGIPSSSVAVGRR